VHTQLHKHSNASFPYMSAPKKRRKNFTQIKKFIILLKCINPEPKNPKFKKRKKKYFEIKPVREIYLKILNRNVFKTLKKEKKIEHGKKMLKSPDEKKNS